MLTNTIKQHVVKLQQKKYRYEFCEFIIEGRKGVEEAIDCGAKVNTIFIQEDRSGDEEFEALITRAKRKHIPVYFVGNKDIKDIKTTATYPGVSAVVAFSPAAIQDTELNGPIIVLDTINDPGNLGTIIRTADWFGVKMILLSEQCVDPYNEKVVRSTMGSMFRMKLVQSTNIVQDIQFLQEQAYHVYGLTMRGKDLKHLKKNRKSAYIFGSESHGIRPELLDRCASLYSIPGTGNAESLNVAISAAIVLYKIS